MSTVLEKPILLDETGQEIVDALVEIKNAINSGVPEGDPVRITIVTPPTKTTYDIGDTLDLSGISVSAIFSNNYMFDITNQCVFTPANGQPATPNGIDISWTWHSTGQTFTVNQPITVDVPLWSTGTDAQIAAALEAHYNNAIDLHDYWSIGDERKVNLSAMSADDGVADADNNSDSHVAQTVTYVLMDGEIKDLATPINGHTKGAFVVGQKDLLGNRNAINPDYPQDVAEIGCIDATNSDSTTNAGGWDVSARREWCNNTYRNAIPSSLRGIFKQHLNVSGGGQGVDPQTYDEYTMPPVVTIDYFALPSIMEISGSYTSNNGNADSVAENQNSQFEYYKTSANRYKKLYDDAQVTDPIWADGSNPPTSISMGYWTRSASLDSDKYLTWNGLLYIDSTSQAYADATTMFYNSDGISPFGVI